MIARLDRKLINQIAAGEVVARPASVVKELVENSLDAGATRIEVSVEDDARTITIRDNGRGMGRKDAKLAIERYATSKIREIDDLLMLTTRGFRGEALAAISSVSRFELLTRPGGEGGEGAEDEEGTIVRCEGGQNIRCKGTGAPPGTSITVRDLFYNTPARLKFLKSATVEWGHIIKTCIRQALTRPDVAFSIHWRGRPYLNLPANQTLVDRLAAVLPGEAGADLIEVDEVVHGVHASGAISSPNTTRRDRRHQYFFVNGRPIVSRPLMFSLQEAYRGLIMTQRFPLCAIFLEIPGEDIDVNVHPAKEEIRFRNEPLAAGSVHRAAVSALRKANLIPHLHLPKEPGAKFANRSIPQDQRIGTGRPSARTEDRNGEQDRQVAQPPQFFNPASSPAAPSEAASPSAQRVDAPALLRPDDPATPSPIPAAESPSEANYQDDTAAHESELIGRLLSGGVRPRLLGQVLSTYILADAQGLGVLLIDQHAAHEKILYVKYRAQRQRPEIQELLVPYTFETGPAGVAAMEALAPALSAEGFETSHFGGETFLVQTVPVVFDRIDVGKFLKELTEDLGPNELQGEIESLRHRIGASAACRAAVMAGDVLTNAEMQSILDQVLDSREALRCPHGRPTMLLLARDQLDRQFGRI